MGRGQAGKVWGGDGGSGAWSGAGEGGFGGWAGRGTQGSARAWAHPHWGTHILAGEPLEAEPDVVVGAPGGLRHLDQDDLVTSVHPVGELLSYKRAAIGGHAGTSCHGTKVFTCPESLQVMTPMLDPGIWESPTREPIMTSQVSQAEDPRGRVCGGLPRGCGAMVLPEEGASPKQTGTFLPTSSSLQSANGTAMVGPATLSPAAVPLVGPLPMCFTEVSPLPGRP